MGSIKMEFKHPKYYKELRKLRNNLDQVISKQQATASSERSPGPGLKSQAPSAKQEVTSYKLPGPRPISNSNKGLIHKRQAKPEPSSGS